MNSIERIWKDAFTEKRISAPKVVNLYQSKSIDIVSKIGRRMRRDNVYLVPFAIASLLVSYYEGLLWIGFYIALVCGLLFVLNRQKMKDLDNLTVTDDILTYLKSYRSKISKIRAFYIKLLAVGTPMVVLPAYYIYFRSNETIVRFFEENPPVVYISFLLFIAALLSAWAVLAYLLSNRLLYGRLMRKLRELIADLEAIL